MKWATCQALRVIRFFAHPVGIVLVPMLCVVALGLFDVNGITYFLSVLSITITQLVLLSQIQGDKALHAKLDGIIEGTDAPNELKGIEQHGS